MSTRTIYTIGYEGADVRDFLGTLRAAKIQQLIDVRAIALSRRPGFSKTALSEELDSVGIAYHHLQELGDPKSGRDAARDGRQAEFERIYRRHLATAKAQAGLQRAIEIATDSDSCLLCYERDFTACHRRIISDAMANSEGFKVVHLGVKFGIAKLNSYERGRSIHRERAIG